MRHPSPIELQRLVDGELGRRRTRAASEHVQRCEECGRAVARIRSVGDLLRLAVDDVAAEAPLEGFADRVMAAIERDERPSRLDRLRAFLEEFFRHRRRVWAPSLALAGASTVALVTLFVLARTPTPTEEPTLGSTVISVSFGNSVNGHVFEMEDKDGSTTTVIWVDESKTAANDSNTEADRDLYWWRTIGTKTT